MELLELVKLGKVLSNSKRLAVVEVMRGKRRISPKEISDALGEGLSQVSYHVKVLRDYDVIRLVKTEPRRGAVEHYYRLTPHKLELPRPGVELTKRQRALLASVVDKAMSNGMARSYSPAERRQLDGAVKTLRAA